MIHALLVALALLLAGYGGGNNAPPCGGNPVCFE
jgi:hypothetical protein